MGRLGTWGRRAWYACLGAWLMLAPQVLLAELRFTSPDRAAGMHDYVENHVVCDDGACVEMAESDALDDTLADACPPVNGPHGGHWWIRADYLMWWIQGNRLPPLVTTSPQGTPRPDAGVLGRSDTAILFGDDRVDDGWRQGVRLTLGAWLDDCQTWGIEGHYLYVGDADGGYQAASTGDLILARPFFDPNPNAQLIGFPDEVAGQIRIDTSSDVNSAGLLLRRAWLQSCQGQVAVVGGYRYFRFRERLTSAEELQYVDSITVWSQDDFAVRNDFHGAEIGLAAEMQRGRWSLDALTKLGAGGVRQRLDVGGRTQANGASGPQDYGLLAHPGNVGHYGDTAFAFLPELGVNVGYCVTPSLSLQAGYSLLWLTDTLRSGDQVDLDSGGPAPLDTTSVCVQGINLGLQWRR